MTRLTILLLQPISYLTGINYSTIPNLWGPHQSPIMVAHTAQKSPFSLASLCSWQKSGTPPHKCPLSPFYCFNLSHTYLGLTNLPSPTIGGPIKAPKWSHIHPKKNLFSVILVFLAKIKYATPKMTPFTILLLQPISYLPGID